MKFFVGLAAFVLIGWALCPPVAAQFENAVWDTLTADTLRDGLTSGAIGINGYEEFHLVYSKALPAGGWNVCYRFFHIYQGCGPETVIVSDRPCYGPVVDSRFSDDDYDITILFESDADIYACASHSPAGPWDCQNMSNSVDPDVTPSVAWGPNYYHAAWTTLVDFNYEIAYMQAGGDLPPQIEIVWDSELGQFGSGAEPFIVADGDDPHIFYRGINSFGYHIHHAYKVYPDSSWNIEYVMTPNAEDYSASAVLGDGDIHVAISGNDGWGFPGRVYYMRWDSDTREWSTPEEAAGQYSATSASIALGYNDRIFVASCGVSGNIYNGDVYLSTYSDGSFETQLLGNFQSVTKPVIANVIWEYGVLVFDAPVGDDLQRNIELIYYGPEILTSVDDQLKPLRSGLGSCYPNPFNSQVNISYFIESAGRVTIDVYDLLGRKVETLIDRQQEPGDYIVNWNAADLPSGLYYYRLQIGAIGQSGKMVLLK